LLIDCVLVNVLIISNLLVKQFISISVLKWLKLTQSKHIKNKPLPIKVEEYN